MLHLAAEHAHYILVLTECTSDSTGMKIANGVLSLFLGKHYMYYGVVIKPLRLYL
jgi:hypothetical protein